MAEHKDAGQALRNRYFRFADDEIAKGAIDSVRTLRKRIPPTELDGWILEDVRLDGVSVVTDGRAAVAWLHPGPDVLSSRFADSDPGKRAHTERMVGFVAGLLRSGSAPTDWDSGIPLVIPEVAPSHMVELECSTCAGGGETKCCECGQDRDCPDCDASGNTYELIDAAGLPADRYVQIDGVGFGMSAIYAEVARSIVPCGTWLYRKAGDAHYIYCQADDSCAIIMSRRAPE